MIHVTELHLQERDGMAVRDFIDGAGTRWRVWETRPAARAAAAPGYETGWLTFESGSMLRRLAPIPGGWEQLPDAELERLCRRATEGRRRRTAGDPSHRMPPTA